MGGKHLELDRHRIMLGVGKGLIRVFRVLKIVVRLAVSAAHEGNVDAALFAGNIIRIDWIIQYNSSKYTQM